MRWGETCVLIAKTYSLDDEGIPQPAETRRTVFCNPQHVGANTWSSMYEIGISVDAKLQVRTCDYEGERDVLYREKYYSVEVVQELGENTVLTLRHQQSDSDDTADTPYQRPESGESGGLNG